MARPIRDSVEAYRAAREQSLMATAIQNHGASGAATITFNRLATSALDNDLATCVRVGELGWGEVECLSPVRFWGLDLTPDIPFDGQQFYDDHGRLDTDLLVFSASIGEVG